MNSISSIKLPPTGLTEANLNALMALFPESSSLTETVINLSDFVDHVLPEVKLLYDQKLALSILVTEIEILFLDILTNIKNGAELLENCDETDCPLKLENLSESTIESAPEIDYQGTEAIKTIEELILEANKFLNSLSLANKAPKISTPADLLNFYQGLIRFNQKHILPPSQEKPNQDMSAITDPTVAAIEISLGSLL